MTSAVGGPSPGAGPSSTAAPDRHAHQQVPERAAGVQLLGQSEGSGYREAPSLVRRADGQTLQLTRLLYLVLEAADGTRSLEDIARRVSEGSGRLVSLDNVSSLMESQLLPMGLLRLADGSEPAIRKADPLLGMRFRYTVTDPERTRKLTAPFVILFNPLLVVAVVAAFLAVCWWLLMVKGLGSATHEAFANPALLLLIFAITLVSAGFHEFGHAAAARKGGATPGAMGAGLYLIWPAFFTDVTDSYRLGRGGRLRTDLGGLYFNAIVAVGIMALWLMVRYDALLLVVVTQILQMIRQLLPLVRFDGYHILADTTGVPDLFQRIKPTLLGLLPWHWGNPETKVLKPWARAVVTVWVLVTVPLLLFSLVMMVLALPRLLATAWDSGVRQQAMLAEALAEGDPASAAVHVLAMIAVALPMLGLLYILVRLLRQVLTGLWRKTRGNGPGRVAAMGVVTALLAGLAWAWWPGGGTYRPVQPYERGTLADATTALLPTSTDVLEEGRSGRTVALWPAGSELPTRDKPQLSMVLVPAAGSPGPGAAGPQGTSSEAAGSPASAAAPAWVFPFDRPALSEDDGNQALAVNTTDGSVSYSVAFALVWAEGDEPVDTKNEAYAFASCSGCTAIAVGFQVVLIVGHADVIVPENLSAAANYNCLDCLTYALASQLVLTLDGPLGPQSMEQLNVLWAEIAAYGRNIHNESLSDIQSRLAAYKDQLTAIITADASASGSSTAGSATTATPTASPVAPSPSHTTAATATAPDVAAPGHATSPERTTEPTAGADLPSGTVTSTSTPAPASVPTAVATAEAPQETEGAAATTPEPAPPTG